MTKKVIIAKSSFIEAVKAELAAKKERHMRLFAQIKPATVQKLQKMKSE